MTDETPRESRVRDDREAGRPAGHTLLLALGVGIPGLVASSSTVRAHEAGHTVLVPGGATASFLAVLGLPVLTGLLGGIVALRHHGRETPKPPYRPSSIAVGLLIAGLGVASLLSSVAANLWVAAVGVAVGATGALWFEVGETASGPGCGTHAELTFGAVSTHRLLEGLVLGTVYAAGAAVGSLASIALASHAALETAAVVGLYATARRRRRVVGAIVLVQVGYVVGVVVGLGLAGEVPGTARTFVLAVVGGLLLVVGTSETGRTVRRSTP
ncbi:hypothetical protein [Haloarchaeobius sp. HRN-SO-5]|uniref:hypothetical protein n=1 Tax=Haloarchaeobius sp. HRN-SO-5 TaxID=3446118 RepID=UPI003EBBD93F